MGDRIGYLLGVAVVVAAAGGVGWAYHKAVESPVAAEAFIRLQDGRFTLRGKPFFPLMLNYVPQYRFVEERLFLGPAQAYEIPRRYEAQTRVDAHRQLAAHFQLIRALGFNSIRLCYDRVNEDENGIFFGADGHKLYLNSGADAALLDALDTLIRTAQAAELYVLLLVQTPTRSRDVLAFTRKLFRRFRHCPTLFAYDLLNEPLYDDDSGAQTKQDVARITRTWRLLRDVHAPRQLITVGTTEPIEVFRWDPRFIHADFLAMHTYHPLRVPNELYWYHHHAGMPYMIGETALPADNDSLTYAAQRQFVRDSYRRALECGSIGYAWWEFQEVDIGYYEGNYTGLLRPGPGLVAPNGYRLEGVTLKPAALEFRDLSTRVKPAAPCTCHVNYYNLLGYRNYVVEGRVLEKATGEPIVGAVVRGWNESWAVGQNTFTRPDGRFTLFSNDRIAHFELSAPGYSRLKFDYSPGYRPRSTTTPPEENLPERDLEYAQIDYRRFNRADSLPDTAQVQALFDFAPAAFDSAAYRAEFPTLLLERFRD